jgi:predicted transcriptional regulator
LKDNIKETQEDILKYLYENKAASPQSQTKIRLAANLEDNKEGLRVLKTSLEALLKKEFIKKQADRGNYKIDLKGIEHIEKEEN